MAGGLAAPVSEGDRPIELHREAIAGIEAMQRLADAHLDCAFEHEDLLIDMRFAKAAVIGDPRAWGQHDLDELDRRRKARRGQVAPYVAGLRVAPFGLILLPRDRRGIAALLRREQRRERHAEARRELVEHARGRAAFGALDERDHRTAYAGAP